MTDIYCVSSILSFLIFFALILPAQGFRKGISPVIATIAMIFLFILGIVLLVQYFKSLFLPL